MFSTRIQPILVFLLAFAVPLATAQGNREDQKNWDAHMSSLERFYERERSSPQGQGSGDGSGLAPALLLAIVGGTLLEWSRKPHAQRPPADYAEETKRQRQSLIYRQCKSTHQSSLVYPRYEKPNSWAAIRIFQSNRADEFKAALAKYQAALAEAEPTCKCVSDRSISDGGFSDAEWLKVAAGVRTERPWLALEESRAKNVFEACAANSPSNTNLSWLYSGATR
jgi:hypothetical protein